MVEYGLVLVVAVVSCLMTMWLYDAGAHVVRSMRRRPIKRRRNRRNSNKELLLRLLSKPVVVWSLVGATTLSLIIYLLIVNLH